MKRPRRSSSHPRSLGMEASDRIAAQGSKEARLTKSWRYLILLTSLKTLRVWCPEVNGVMRISLMRAALFKKISNLGIADMVLLATNSKLLLNRNSESKTIGLPYSMSLPLERMFKDHRHLLSTKALKQSLLIWGSKISSLYSLIKCSQAQSTKT